MHRDGSQTVPVKKRNEIIGATEPHMSDTRVSQDASPWLDRPETRGTRRQIEATDIRKILLYQWLRGWRREGDSNPRNGLTPFNGLAIRKHPSGLVGPRPGSLAIAGEVDSRDTVLSGLVLASPVQWVCNLVCKSLPWPGHRSAEHRSRSVRQEVWRAPERLTNVVPDEPCDHVPSARRSRCREMS